MYIEHIFNVMKDRMIQELEEVKLMDFDSYKERTRHHHKIIEQLIELSSMTDNINEVKDITPVLEPAEPIEIEEIYPTEEYPIGHTFTFLKKAFGGVIDEMNYPIPEELVRVLHIENGNIIRITGIKGNFSDGTPIYDFTIVDRTNIPNPSLAEVNQGIVEEIGGRLVVTETTTGMIKFEEVPVSLFVSDKDALRFKIAKGDIINGRFYTNNITNSFRVTYKYDTESNDLDVSIESKKLQYRQNNMTESTESGLSMIDRLDKTPFLNKKILLVGLSSRMNDFKLTLSGTDELDFVHLSGDDHKTKTRSNILKADYVLVSTQENSHDTSKYVAMICNDNGIPFTSTHSDGLFSILMDAKELIDQQEKTAKGA